MPSKMAIMIIGRPTHKYQNINSKHLTWWQNQIWERGSISNACCSKISHGNTPWDDVIHVHIGVNVVNFHNEQVEVDSLDQHPAKGSHQEILHQSCYCDTSSLRKEICFVSFCDLFWKYLKQKDLINWMNRSEKPLTVCSVAWTPARKISYPTPRDAERLNRIWDRGWRTSLMKWKMTKKESKNKNPTWVKKTKQTNIIKTKINEMKSWAKKEKQTNQNKHQKKKSIKSFRIRSQVGIE